MSITREWRKRTNSWFDQIYQHAFVQGIAKQSLTSEQVVFYVAQDRAYLQSYLQICGLGIAKAQTREDIRFFSQIISAIVKEEQSSHIALLTSVGANEEDLARYPLAQTSQAYINHMKTFAYEGRLPDLLAALLPCPWTYYDLAKRILEEYVIEDSHSFAEWIYFYASESAMTDMMRKRLDELIEDLPLLEQERLYVAFEQSCRWEWEFWEASHQLRV